MLTRDDNELLCKVGPGTPMGNLFRQYWLPAGLANELPDADGAPLRLRLLSEDMVAFRTTAGAIGLIAGACPHRGASLFFGRNEEEGLRCVYHGWKFDTTGACVDMPNEPAESNFKHKIRATAYECVERGGVLWVYMGPRETPPEMPQIESNMLPDGEWNVNAFQVECNWMQRLEGDIDTSHTAFLHNGALDDKEFAPSTFAHYVLKDRAPRYQVVETESGAMYGAYRPAQEDTYYWRIANFLFPCFSSTPTGVLGLEVRMGARVPIDDDHCLTISMQAKSKTSSTQQRYGDRPLTNGLPELLPNTTGALGRFRTVANRANDYQIDRQAQKTVSYSGINTIGMQDQAICESMGPIYDRSREHLGTSDMMIIRTRRRLIEAARALRDHGAIPPGVDSAAAYAIRSGGVVLPRTANWVEATAGYRTAFTDQPSLTRAVLGGSTG